MQKKMGANTSLHASKLAKENCCDECGVERRSSVETRIIEAIERAQKANVGNFSNSRKLKETSKIYVDVIYQKKDQIPMETIVMI
jgi:hypothetical protein